MAGGAPERQVGGRKNARNAWLAAVPADDADAAPAASLKMSTDVALPTGETVKKAASA